MLNVIDTISLSPGETLIAGLIVTTSNVPPAPGVLAAMVSRVIGCVIWVSNVTVVVQPVHSPPLPVVGLQPGGLRVCVARLERLDEPVIRIVVIQPEQLPYLNGVVLRPVTHAAIAFRGVSVRVLWPSHDAY